MKLTSTQLVVQLSLFFCMCSAARAQLVFTVSSPKLYGEKAIVRLDMKNEFTQAIESARAAVFLVDDSGKVVGQKTQWIIGGQQGRKPLAAGATNVFFFVVNGTKPFASSNLVARVQFSRLILEGGKLGDIHKDIQITTLK